MSSHDGALAQSGRTWRGTSPRPALRSIIISKGSFEGVFPGLIMANGARMEGIEANVCFTFFGMDAINLKHYEHIKVATVGNPGLHIPTMLGGLLSEVVQAPAFCPACARRTST